MDTRFVQGTNNDMRQASEQARAGHHLIQPLPLWEPLFPYTFQQGVTQLNLSTTSQGEDNPPRGGPAPAGKHSSNADLSPTLPARRPAGGFASPSCGDGEQGRVIIAPSYTVKPSTQGALRHTHRCTHWHTPHTDAHRCTGRHRYEHQHTQHTDAHRCTQVHTDAHRHAHRYTQVHTGAHSAHRCPQVHTGASRCTEMPTGTHRCTRVDTGMHRDAYRLHKHTHRCTKVCTLAHRAHKCPQAHTGVHTDAYRHIRIHTGMHAGSHRCTQMPTDAHRCT